MTSGGELLAALRAAAELLDPVAEPAPGGETTWTRAGKPFAIHSGATAELRVGPAIAAAAVRTPDTFPSQQGPDWIAFAPPMLDEHALDRLGAWFAAAYRRAAD